MTDKPISPSLARLLEARGREDLVVALARERHVATPAGARRYGKPLKSLITPGMIEKAKAVLHGRSKATQAARGGSGSQPSAAPAPGASPSASPSASHAPLSDAEYQAHFDAALAKYESVKDTLSTDLTQKDAQGDWKTERKEEQKALMDKMYDAASNVPNNGKAILSGGLGGSGKGTVLGGGHIGIKPGEYFTIDADLVKTAMIDAGMTPKVEGLSEGEAAGLIHHESAEIAKALMRRAVHERKNVILDVTMAEAGGGSVAIKERLDLLHASGYTDVNAVFVDVPVEVAQARAQARHRKGLELARQGIGHGGRMVPPEVIAANGPPANEPDFPYNSRNRRVFESFKSQFTNWEVWDNSGLPTETKRVESKSDTSISGQPIDKSATDKLASGVTGTAQEQVAAKQTKAGEQ